MTAERGTRAIFRWWRRLQVMVVKEIRQLLRDVPLLLFLIYAFTIEIYLAGSGGALELNRAKVIVHDADRTDASRDLIYRFMPPYFEMAGEVRDIRTGLAMLDRGDALVLLDVPERFEETLIRGERAASVQMQIDTSNTTLGYLAASYGAQIGAIFARERTESLFQDEGLPVIRNEQRVWFNQDLKDSWYKVISELLTMMTAVSVLLPGAAMVREKERGTIEQLLVSPISPFQVLISKVLAMDIVILIATAVSLFVIMQPIFGLPVRGSLVLFFSLVALYVFTTAGLGLLVATVARNSAQVGMLTILFVTPMIMLSGTWTPPEAMPEVLQYLIRLSPLNHFIEISYGILLRGAGVSLLWDSILAMFVMGNLLLLVGVWRFRRMFG
ncbi:MAG TPA: ABC transporter permease [Dissulfurispiraceae bacterium]|nr:ABC transporter permease [Dissulfurispiraceae bacterium]